MRESCRSEGSDRLQPENGRGFVLAAPFLVRLYPMLCFHRNRPVRAGTRTGSITPKSSEDREDGLHRIASSESRFLPLIVQAQSSVSAGFTARQSLIETAAGRGSREQANVSRFRGLGAWPRKE